MGVRTKRTVSNKTRAVLLKINGKNSRGCQEEVYSLRKNEEVMRGMYSITSNRRVTVLRDNDYEVPILPKRAFTVGFSTINRAKSGTVT